MTKIQVRCEKCGKLMEYEQEKTDDYNMLLGKEQHRQCPTCADMPDNAMVNVNRFRDTWNPDEADKTKIGFRDDAIELDDKNKPKEFKQQRVGSMGEVFLE
jgi:endogenous inhibitor of DNA gyrase (YacG/DUF329 family)